MVGVCGGDELLEPPSCGQLPGHRMEGPRAACLMEEAPERQAREPEGSGERNGRELSGCDSECMWVLVVHRASVSTGWDPMRTRKSEAKAAGQKSVPVSVLFVIVWGNMRQARRGRRGTDRHAGEEGAQTDRYPSGGGPGSDRRSGRKADCGCLKGNQQFGDPVLPRSHHRSPHIPGSRSALLSAGAGPGCALCGRAARPGTNSLHVARRRRSTARRVTASARAGCGAHGDGGLVVC